MIRHHRSKRSDARFRPRPLEACEGRALLSALPISGTFPHVSVYQHHQHQMGHPITAVNHTHGQRNPAISRVIASHPTGFAHTPIQIEPEPPASGPTGYSPAQVRHAYGFDQLGTNEGAGQTIYIIDAYDDPTIASDLATFNTQFGLPQMDGVGGDPTFTNAKPQGSPRSDSGWALEISLDVEWAHAIAPLANIVLVEAKSNSNANLFGAVDWAVGQGAHVVSMSWGGRDSSGDANLDSHFNKAGVTFVASAGDTGGAVESPSSSPYVLSVGGTSLPLDSSGNRTGPETAWSSGGGGPSAYEGIPTYQTNYGITGTGRGTPDVSYDANPNTGFAVYDTTPYQGQSGWFQVGGTSAGAPEWAALIALADEGHSTPLSTNNLTSRTEYKAATGSIYGTNYVDITSGSNGYSAGPGYDYATGLGSPQAQNLVPWLRSKGNSR